jgi:hypothetical protein
MSVTFTHTPRFRRHKQDDERVNDRCVSRLVINKPGWRNRQTRQTSYVEILIPAEHADLCQLY